jgi:signal transduction histidine kinase
VRWPAGYDRRMSSDPSPSSGSRTLLAWFGAAAFPPLLFLVLAAGPLNSALRFVMIVLVMLLPVGAMRRNALLVLGLVLFTLAVMTATFHSWPGATWYVNDAELVGVNLTIGFVAASRPRRVSVPAAGLALLVEIMIGAAFLDHPPVDTAVMLILVTVTAWVVGQSVRQRRQNTAARRAQEAVQVIQAERLRIARELHDMIAHSIGVIAIQAGMGRRVIDTQPAEARGALATIEETSRETLAGLRRMLVALRGAEPDGSAPLAPAPGLADLHRLAARSAAAGVRIDVCRLGDPGPLPPEIDLSAYRIVQESVTNVVRHAGTDRCQVTVKRSGGALSIEVTDDGAGGTGAPGTGYGIPGMRERVSLLHGEFAAAPRPEGGFRVTARIPVPEGGL